jgi:hypothetical protein
MSTDNRFIFEIEEDYHQELLKRGNLERKRQIPFTPRWTNAGYLARIIYTSCTCGSLTENPPSLFHVQTDQSGSRELSPIHPSQIQAGLPRRIERVAEKTDICALCLPSLGFTEP